MSTMKKLAKSGMFGLAGLAATNPKITNKIARSGGFGVLGMMAAKKKKKAAEAAGGMRGRPMVEDIMVAEEAPAGAMMRKGGKVKKMAKGGKVSSASKRGDGCATKGKTKGRFV
jgi:hypothetical protein